MHRPRYAIYYAPAQRSKLWELASQWLGRDAYTGENLARMLVPAISDVDIDRLTSSPRHYGFHATLKAPFELAPDATAASLVEFARAFAARQRPFDVALAPASLGWFLALRLVQSSPEMTDLHTACVREFDPFRAPLTEGDINRRKKANLTETQEARLLEWGYPYIFDEFRFHMTLTGGIQDEALRERILGVLQQIFPETRERVDGVALYQQPDRESAFTIVERFEFGAPTSS